MDLIPHSSCRRGSEPAHVLWSSMVSWGDRVMAPPLLPARIYGPSRPVTVDTPPDLLEGTMDLHVTLPSEETVFMSVHRSTPIMDLLVQITSAHRITPGGHSIQVISDNIFQCYKSSTPIGTLDTSAIKIVSKNKANADKTRRKSVQQQALERNIRLKVNLPRNQLAVYRVPPKTLISEVLAMVCKDKHLDDSTHEIRHPVNIDERLRGSCSLNDYQLQEICVVPKDFRPSPLSATDFFTMTSIAHPEDKKRRGGFLGFFSRKPKSSTGDSSVSSGSAGERSVSPDRSDESSSGRPAPRALSPISSSSTLPHQLNGSEHLASSVPSTSNHNQSMTSLGSTTSTSSSAHQHSRPTSLLNLSKARKRPAPVPPSRKNESSKQVQNKIKSAKENRTSLLLSRTSLDSSGEQESKSSPSSPMSSEANSLEITTTSLSQSSNMSHMNSSSVSSIASKNKRRAPPPPKLTVRKDPSAIPEETTERNLTNGNTEAVVSHPVDEVEGEIIESSIHKPAPNGVIENSDKATSAIVINQDDTSNEVVKNRDDVSNRLVNSQNKDSDMLVNDQDEAPNRLVSNKDEAPNRLVSNKDEAPNRLVSNKDEAPNRLVNNKDEAPNRLVNNQDEVPDRLVNNQDEASSSNKLVYNNNETRNELVNNPDEVPNVLVNNPDESIDMNSNSITGYTETPSETVDAYVESTSIAEQIEYESHDQVDVVSSMDSQVISSSEESSLETQS